jgi:hypothetical protein
MKFSQKIGKTPIRQALQVESIDSALENRLWNNILADFFGKISSSTHKMTHYRKSKASKTVWTEFFGNRLDEIPSDSYGEVKILALLQFIKNWFFKVPWYEKYDLIEFISLLDKTEYYFGFSAECNNTLIRESAGYRIINNSIVQITSEEEIVEIEEAINSSSNFNSVEIHLKTALDYLSDREKPDYRNSIKESISAVESFCIIITGDKTATLGGALTQIDNKYQIHGALKKAFTALYGYTSDSGGIRHALLEKDIEVTMADAKFMLVTCSAFINYLKLKI